MPKIILASDHRGFTLKNLITKTLSSLGYEVEDFGPKMLNPDDDYTDFVGPAMKAVQNDEKNRGIVMCKNGVGVSIAANRFKKVRCGLCFSKEHVISARNDDNINVLALPVEFISEKEALDILAIFLNTPASLEKRHLRRQNKIEELG